MVVGPQQAQARSHSCGTALMVPSHQQPKVLLPHLAREQGAQVRHSASRARRCCLQTQSALPLLLLKRQRLGQKNLSVKRQLQQCILLNMRSLLHNSGREARVQSMQRRSLKTTRGPAAKRMRKLMLMLQAEAACMQQLPALRSRGCPRLSLHRSRYVGLCRSSSVFNPPPHPAHAPERRSLALPV